MVITGISLVNRTKAENWTKSFRRVNLDPRDRDDFPTWCKRINQYLTAGELFKNERAYTSSA